MFIPSSPSLPFPPAFVCSLSILASATDSETSLVTVFTLLLLPSTESTTVPSTSRYPSSTSIRIAWLTAGPSFIPTRLWRSPICSASSLRAVISVTLLNAFTSISIDGFTSRFTVYEFAAYTPKRLNAITMTNIAAMDAALAALAPADGNSTSSPVFQLLRPDTFMNLPSFAITTEFLPAFSINIPFILYLPYIFLQISILILMQKSPRYDIFPLLFNQFNCYTGSFTQSGYR